MSRPAGDITIINVVSTSYSGSTWLASTLGAHPDAFVVGELDSITRTGRPICTLHGSDCPVWSRFEPGTDASDIYRQISRVSGKRVLVVTNTRKFLDAQQAPGITTRWVFLVRDGRAVVASTLRKNPRATAWSAARSWARTIRKKQRLVGRQAPDAVSRVRYEELLANTNRDLPVLCERLGLSWAPCMLEYWTQDMHYLGGNPGAMSTIAREKKLPQIHFQSREARQYHLDVNQPEQTLPDARRVDFSYYQRVDPRRFRDERWRSELTPMQLRLFALAAGRLNRKLGYT